MSAFLSASAPGHGGCSITSALAAPASRLAQIMDFAGTTAPAGWLLCFGQSVSRATYAALFAAIGTTYGTADGSSFQPARPSRSNYRRQGRHGRIECGASQHHRLDHARHRRRCPDAYTDHCATGQPCAYATGNFYLRRATLSTTRTQSSGTRRSMALTRTIWPVAGSVPRIIRAALPEPPISDRPSTPSPRPMVCIFTAFSCPVRGGANVNHTHTTTISGATVAAGSDSAHNNIQPTLIMQKIIKV